MDFNLLYTDFQSVTNYEKASKMSAYMKNHFDFLGISAPHRRAIQQSFFKANTSKSIDWAFVEACWDCPYRELQYVAADYLRKKQKMLSENDIERLKSFIIRKSWWDSVDTLSPLIGKITFENPSLNSLMIEWSVDANFWLRRVAIIHQLSRKNATNTELLEQIITNNFGSKEFFINKAIGWALRDFSKSNSLWVSTFIEKYRAKMASLSIREASKFLQKNIKS